MCIYRDDHRSKHIRQMLRCVYLSWTVNVLSLIQDQFIVTINSQYAKIRFLFIRAIDSLSSPIVHLRLSSLGVQASLIKSEEVDAPLFVILPKSYAENKQHLSCRCFNKSEFTAVFSEISNESYDHLFADPSMSAVCVLRPQWWMPASKAAFSAQYHRDNGSEPGRTAADVGLRRDGSSGAQQWQLPVLCWSVCAGCQHWKQQPRWNPGSA